jgi:hypothetical protein
VPGKKVALPIVDSFHDRISAGLLPNLVVTHLLPLLPPKKSCHCRYRGQSTECPVCKAGLGSQPRRSLRG